MYNGQEVPGLTGRYGEGFGAANYVPDEDYEGTRYLGVANDWEQGYIAVGQTPQGYVLREAIYRALDVIRVYTKLPQAKEPDYSKPFTIRRGGTLVEVAGLVHKDMAKNLRFARVWGSHVHDATTVKGDYVLHDRDVVELHSG